MFIPPLQITFDGEPSRRAAAAADVQAEFLLISMSTLAVAGAYIVHAVVCDIRQF